MSTRSLREIGISDAESDDGPEPDDSGVSFFRGLVCCVTVGSVFWALVAAVFLIN